MRQQLVETELGTALLITPEVKLVLGSENEVDFVIENDHAIIRRPADIVEAVRKSHEKFAEAYRELAK